MAYYGSKKKKSLLREYAEALIVALLLAFVIRTFVVQAFKIPSESMLQTLLVGDHLLATKYDYGLRIPFTSNYIYQGENPQRGDIIIFEYPKDTSVDYIKRIVGIPGDIIEVRNKQLFRNGEAVREDYIQYLEPSVTNMPRRDNFGPVEVPANSYFVMGDNRDNSEDSRFWGFVHRERIRAKAWRIYWSWGDVIRWGRMGQRIQ